MIKSEFKIIYIFSFIFFSLFFLLALGFVTKAFYNIFTLPEISSGMVHLFFAVALFIASIYWVKDYKYIVFNVSDKEFISFSIRYPFGKVFKLKKFIGILKTVERYNGGISANVFYLIDKSSMTSFKVNQDLYKNPDEIYNSISLKKIEDNDLGFKKYVCLLLTGRIKVKGF